MHRHHPLRWILVILTCGIAAFFLTPKVSEALDALHSLDAHATGWLIVGVLGELGSLLVFTLVTFTLLDLAVRPTFNRLLKIDLATIALSHAVPAGSAAGTALGYGLLAEAGVGGVEAAFVKVSQSVISGIMLQVLLVIALVTGAVTEGSSAAYLGTGIAGGVIMLATLTLAGILHQRPEWIRNIAGGTLGRIPKLSRPRVEQVVMSLSERLRGLTHDRSRLAIVCGWSMANWLLDLMSLWACLHAFGANTSLVKLTVAFAVAQVVASLPVSPGGLGLVEGSLIGILAGFGTPESVAVLGVLIWRLWNFWLPLPIGAGAYGLILFGRRRERPAVPAETSY
jgi:uncharacterized protein (TIRG00374 family)